MAAGAYSDILPGARDTGDLPVIGSDEVRYVRPGEGDVLAGYTAHDTLATAGLWSCVGVALRSQDGGMDYLAHCPPGDVEDGRNTVIEEFLDGTGGQATPVEATYAVSRPVGVDATEMSTGDLLAATECTLEQSDAVEVVDTAISRQEPPAGLAVRRGDDQMYTYARESVTGPDTIDG